MYDGQETVQFINQLKAVMENHFHPYTPQQPEQDPTFLIAQFILLEMPHSAHRLRSKLSSFRKREGGLSGVTLQVILKFICLCRYAKWIYGISKEWLSSVKDLAKLIFSDSTLRLHFQFAISRSSDTLKKFSGLELLDIIDSALKIGPQFSNSELVGFPLNSIFIEFMQTQNGRAFFSSEKVNRAFKAILNDYGKMLQTEESLRFMNDKEGGWFSSEALKKIDYSQYECDPFSDHYGFKNWNQWFLRQFKQGRRPIGKDFPNTVAPENVIVNACESTPLSYPQQPSRNVKLVDQFWFKDDKYSLFDMFGAEHLNKQHWAAHFEGGTIYQAFLSALNYHRWHSPLDGLIIDIYNIEGTYLFDQSQFLDQFDEGAPNNSQSFLSAVAARQVFIIQSLNPLIGKIAIIFIGMAEVSSCVATVSIGQEVRRGQQIGHFAFGGSSHTIIFEKRANLTFSDHLYEVKEGKKGGRQQLLHSFLAYVS